jgi:hypothetical protein
MAEARDEGHEAFAVQAADGRFPRLLQPRFDGVTLNPGAGQSLSFPGFLAVLLAAPLGPATAVSANGCLSAVGGMQ